MKLHRIAVCVTYCWWDVAARQPVQPSQKRRHSPQTRRPRRSAQSRLQRPKRKRPPLKETIETTGTEDMTAVPTMMAMETVTGDDATAAETAAAETTASTAGVGAVGAGDLVPISDNVAGRLHDHDLRQGLGSPRFMAYSPDGTLYVTDIAGGRVPALPDTNGDGVADSTSVAIENLVQPHGIAFHENALYVGETNQIVRFAAGDGAWGEKEVIVPDLPTGGDRTRTIVFGQDNRMYVSIGSS